MFLHAGPELEINLIKFIQFSKCKNPRPRMTPAHTTSRMLVRMCGNKIFANIFVFSLPECNVDAANCTVLVQK